MEDRKTEIINLVMRQTNYDKDTTFLHIINFLHLIILISYRLIGDNQNLAILLARSNI